MATKKKSSKKTSSKQPEKKKAAKVSKKPGKDARAKATDRNDSGRKRVIAAKKAVERSRNYAAAGLAAQVIETLLDEIRSLDNLWHKTPEAQQAVIIARLSDRVYNAMSEAVQIMSAVGHKAVICNLFSVTFKDGVKGTITVAPGSDMRHELADYATKDCVLVLADPAVFMQGIADVRPDADQPRLI